MSNNVEDLQMLRLIKVFQKIRDQEARRAIILFAEKQLEAQERKSRADQSV